MTRAGPVSDYFGALLRAAGALAAPMSMPTSPPAAAPGDDLVEQDFEVQAGVPGEPTPDRAVPAHEALAAPPPAAAPHADEPVHRAAVAPEPPAAPAAVPDAPPAVAPAAPSPRPGDAALAHPMVRAALRWVAADQALPAQAQAALPTHAAAFARARSLAEAGPVFAPAQPLVASAADADRPPALPARPQTARETGEIELTLPAAPRRAGEGVAAPRPAVAPTRGIDLHIGTIHVAVDAPPPRTVQPVQPVQPPAPVAPPAPRAAERSGLSRSRLPKL